LFQLEAVTSGAQTLYLAVKMEGKKSSEESLQTQRDE
jgi:hypothetical protein